MGEIKPSFDTKREVLGKVLPLDTPFTVIIDSSEKCNFKCKYCFRSNPDESMWGYAKCNKNMEKPMFETVIKQLKEFPNNVRTISLSNHGEPLCNPNLPWMIKRVREYNIGSRISLHTNGSLLKGKMLHDMIDANPDRIVISIQGMSNEAYRNTCGVNLDIDELIQSIKFFFEHKKDTQVCVKIVDVALNEGEEDLFYNTFLPIADRVFVEKECDIWKTTEISQKQYHELGSNKYDSKFKWQLVCPVIFHTIVVTPNGDVYPCTQLVGQSKLGNVKENTLKQLWDSNIRNSLLREQLTHDVETGACVGCGIKPNSFFTKEDLIDEYKDEVITRLEC